MLPPPQGPPLFPYPTLFRSGRAPSLETLYNRPVRLQDGRTVIADENYLRESILNPRAKVVAGYEPIMPTFQGIQEERSEEHTSELQSRPQLVCRLLLQKKNP